jgi:hypothetical protein
VETPLGEVVDGCNKLGTWLVTEWSEQASEVAAKLDDGTYDADSAAADLAKTATLAAESWFLLASEALAAVALLSRQERYIVEDTFDAPAGARLELAGPLEAGFEQLLPVTLVSVVPSQLAPTRTAFKLIADATTCAAGTYDGTVLAFRDDAAPVEVFVSLIVA